MDKSKEFQVEYTILLPVPRHGNFSAFGNPFDREEVLAHIAHHAGKVGEPVDWSQTLGLTYDISETARLLDNPWNSHHGGKATAEEMLELERKNRAGESSKISRMREMHDQSDG
ncbi:MAG TPA: hypothetical protein VH186_07045 [Chloroflexia bacterium]|nr:hypothetical protein [Chloroflexia bacterium]